MLSPAPDLTPEIAVLLRRAMFPDPARIALALEAYRTHPDRRIFVWDVGGRPVCAVGVQLAGREAQVLHIGTRPEQAGRGHGRQLVYAVAAQLGLTRLTAETDDDAVGFYRRSGFEVAEVPGRGGRRRYLCTLKLGETGNPEG